MFCPRVWRDALQLASNYSFLNSIIRSVAAQHLHFLQPNDRGQRMTAARCLDRGLAQFRAAFSDDLTSVHIDAFVAASLLLLHNVWADTDNQQYVEAAPAAADSASDELFTISSSIKEVFLKSVRLAPDQESIFMSYVACDPTIALTKAAKIGKESLDRFQIDFTYDRPINPRMLEAQYQFERSTEVSTDAWAVHSDTEDLGGYRAAVARLCLIVSFLPEADPPELITNNEALLRHAARYILSFPLMGRGQFTYMVKQNDVHAMLVLYHFYRAARILLPQHQYWWACKRALIAEAALKDWLMGQVVEQG